MEAIKRFFRNMRESVKNQQAKDAQKSMLEELFNDYYLRRRDVYKMNFFRGVFFGLGSALGGTLVLALLIWLLSLFVDLPLIGQWFQEAQNTINQQ